MTTRFALVLAVLVVAPAGAGAQSDGRFRSGPLTWTPTLTLRDAGVDTNVYDEAIDPKRDTAFVVAPQVDGKISLAAFDLRFGGGSDFVYFQRYTQERSVNVRANGRLELKGTRVRPFVGVGFVDARERVNSEIDVRARHEENDIAAGIGIQVTPRAMLEAGGQFSRARFRQGEVFRGVDLAHRLNRDNTGATVRLKYELTPLTHVVADWQASRDRFVESPAFDADTQGGHVGVEFEPDAIIRGRATLGYTNIKPVGALSVGYEGFTTSVDLGYVLMGRTRFDVRVARDTSYSFESQPYFLRTMYGAEVLQNLFGPVDVIGRGSWEKLDYPGVAERLLPADALEVLRYGGAVAIRAGRRSSLTLNYEYSERTAGLVADRRYERHRLYTTVIYGF